MDLIIYDKTRKIKKLEFKILEKKPLHPPLMKLSNPNKTFDKSQNIKTMIADLRTKVYIDRDYNLSFEFKCDKLDFDEKAFDKARFPELRLNQNQKIEKLEKNYQEKFGEFSKNTRSLRAENSLLRVQQDSLHVESSRPSLFGKMKMPLSENKMKSNQMNAYFQLNYFNNQKGNVNLVSPRVDDFTPFEINKIKGFFFSKNKQGE